MEPTLLDSIASPPATEIELTTVVAFAAGVLLWVRGAKLTESATLILGLAGGALVGARLASVGGFEGVGTMIMGGACRKTVCQNEGNIIRTLMT